MRKKNRAPDGEGSWLNTYSDMVTLLLTFFIVLFSMSSVQQEKFDELLRSFANPNGKADQLIIVGSDASDSSQAGPAQNNQDDEFLASASTPPTQEGLPSNMDQLYEYLKQYVQDNGKEESIEVNKENGIVYIRFSNDMLFEPDKSNLTEESKKTLRFLGSGLKNMEDLLKLIQITGHTAQTNIPDYKINDWILSSGRAANVATFLEEEMQVKKELLLPQGRGDSYPIANNDTAAGRQKNRRVEMAIVGTESLSSGVDDSLSGTYDGTRYPADGTEGGLLLPPSGSDSNSEPASGSEPVSEADDVSPYED